MFRCWFHVLTWLSVAAFLFANAHTSSALTALVHAAKKPAAAADGKRTCCSHCRARQAKAEAPATTPKGTAATATDRHPSCPCWPDRDPWPDDCVLCSIAKVHVTVTPTIDLQQFPTIAESWTEPVCLHILTYSGELMRPPRC